MLEVFFHSLQIQIIRILFHLPQTAKLKTKEIIFIISKIIFRCFLILMYIPLLRYVDKLITQKYTVVLRHISILPSNSPLSRCVCYIGNHRRSNTTALVRTIPETFKGLGFSPTICLLSPKGDACPDEIGFNSRLKLVVVI